MINFYGYTLARPPAPCPSNALHATVRLSEDAKLKESISIAEAALARVYTGALERWTDSLIVVNLIS